MGRVLVCALADVIDGPAFIGAAGTIIEARIFVRGRLFAQAAGASALLFTVRSFVALADAGLAHGLAHFFSVVGAGRVDFLGRGAHLRALSVALRTLSMPLALERAFAPFLSDLIEAFEDSAQASVFANPVPNEESAFLDAGRQ